GFSKPQIETQQRGFFVTVLSGQRARQCLAPIRVGGSHVGLGLLARDDAFWRHHRAVARPARPLDSHSLRRAVMGSTAMARRVGKWAAASVTTITTATPAARAAGSAGLTRESKAGTP